MVREFYADRDYDETGSIGKRYRRQDEIGTPYCLTVDFDSLEDKKVTVRDRDTMEQERVAVNELTFYFASKLVPLFLKHQATQKSYLSALTIQF